VATLLTETDVRAKDGLTRLSPEQLQELKERGFVTVRAIAPPTDVAVMDTVIRDLLARGVGFKEGARRDLVDPEDSPGANSLTELVRPQNYAAVLRRSAYFESAYAIARQVLGQDAEFAFDHAILKPAFHGAETPWHQDEAYQAERDSERDQIAFWMPTAVATVENGCMRYIPGSHKVGVLPHQPLGGDARVHGDLAIDDIGQGIELPQHVRTRRLANRNRVGGNPDHRRRLAGLLPGADILAHVVPAEVVLALAEPVEAERLKLRAHRRPRLALAREQAGGKRSDRLADHSTLLSSSLGGRSPRRGGSPRNG
jgi:hypothetical protein